MAFKYDKNKNEHWDAVAELHKERRRQSCLEGISILLLLFGFLALVVFFLSWLRWSAGCSFPADTLASEIPARCLAYYR